MNILTAHWKCWISGKKVHNFDGMQTRTYNDLVKYLKKGSFPSRFPSTKSNFVREAKKYKVNKKGVLLRGKLIVVKKSERKKIFNDMHHHSGKS